MLIVHLAATSQRHHLASAATLFNVVAVDDAAFRGWIHPDGKCLRVVAGFYDPSSDVGKFCLAFSRYGPQHVEGADVVDAVAFHDDAFRLTDAVSRR